MKSVQKALLTNFHMPLPCFGIDSVSYCYASCTYPALSNYKQNLVDCRIHTQLKHYSHLFKAQVSGKVGSYFLVASLIHPCKVTQTQLYNIYLLCCLSPSFCTTANLQLEINCLPRDPNGSIKSA